MKPAESSKFAPIAEDDPGVRHLWTRAARVDGCLPFGAAGGAAAIGARTPDAALVGFDLGAAEPADRGGRYAFGLLEALAKDPIPAEVFAALRHERDRPSTSAADQGQATGGSPSPFAFDDALDGGWLELWYQPKFNLRTGRPAGVEVLIRARHPAFGLIGAAQILAGLAEADLHRLTEFVLQRAFADWRQFERAGWPIEICVNIPASAVDAGRVLQLLRAHQPRSASFPGLVLEITEDQALRYGHQLRIRAAELGIYKVELSLDDFGQGYATLARLRGLPFTSLKLDNIFVAGCGTDKTQAHICQAVIDLGRRFGCSVVAEGIESASDLHALRQMGCDFGQGFLFGHPAPLAETITRLRAWGYAAIPPGSQGKPPVSSPGL